MKGALVIVGPVLGATDDPPALFIIWGFCSALMDGLLLFCCCFNGKQTEQSSLLHCFQCAIICREEAQCGTEFKRKKSCNNNKA